MESGQFSPLGQILLFTGAGIAFITGALVISKLIGPNRPGSLKSSTYESGEAAVGRPWPQTGSGYFVLALLFLLFEVEIVILFPLAAMFGAAPAGSGRTLLWLSILAFVIVLSVALAYALSLIHI